jgi:parallel beta-helix repeat protein
MLFLVGNFTSVISINLNNSIQNSSRGFILYVGGNGPGNFSRIQDAIDNASDGDTVFVYDDSSPYYENLIVYKSINLIGEDKNTTIIDGDVSGNVVYILTDWVNITGFTIQNGGNEWDEGGIHINSNYNTITDNIISNNTNDGIYLNESIENIITINIISNNEGNGIELPYYTSNNTTITGNKIFNNDNGIFIYASNDNIIIDNSFINNGLYIYFPYKNNVFNNTVNGKPLVYLEDESDIIIDNAGQVILINCENITILNQEISNTDVGFSLWYTHNCHIFNNTIISNNKKGIFLYDSNSNNILGNTISNNYFDGIAYKYSYNNTITGNTILNNYYGIWNEHSNNNTITSNNISKNKEGIRILDSNSNTITENNISNNRIGIGLHRSSKNTITGNRISNNKWRGIQLNVYCNNNIITGNNISNNDKDGLILEYSGNNTINGNNILNNYYGIRISYSNRNSILKNNFIGNKRHAFLEDSWKNIWKHNFWNKSRLLPKPIFGYIKLKYISIPWFIFDWRPALEQYEI